MNSSVWHNRENRGLPKDMVQKAKMLKKGEVTFHRKQDVLLVSHDGKRLINTISHCSCGR